MTFLLVVSWIRPEYGGDPLVYGAQAFDFLQRHGLAETRGMLEFGHLIWRPLAAAGTGLGASALARLAGIEPKLVAVFVLIALSMVFTLIAFLLVFRIAKLLSGSIAAGAVVALLFLFANAVLIYMRSGYPYLPGTAMQLLAVSMVVAPPEKVRLWLRAFLIGLALAVSVCFWAPYVVSVPGVIVFAFLWRDNDLERSERMRLALQTLLWTMVLTCAAFGSAILLNDFRSFAQVAQWIRDSSHEWAQTHRLVRLATGLPRCLISVQEESLMLKRLFFHDPYAPVRWSQVLAAVAWKPPLFAAGVGALGLILARTAAGRRLLIGALCCWIPLIIFSVAIFEPGSPERFLPGFALLFACLGYAANKLSTRDPATWVLSAFFAAMIAMNVASVAPAAANVRDHQTEQRLAAVAKVCRPNTLLALLSYRDDIFRFENVEPFNSLSRIPFHPFNAMEAGTLRGLRFRQEFATAALNAWNQGAEVWISQRLISTRPLPEWGWVEGDNPGVRWSELSGFYRQFGSDAKTGGDDGFVRIAASEKNRLLLESALDLPQSRPVVSY